MYSITNTFPFVLNCKTSNYIIKNDQVSQNETIFLPKKSLIELSIYNIPFRIFELNKPVIFGITSDDLGDHNSKILTNDIVDLKIINMLPIDITVTCYGTPSVVYGTPSVVYGTIKIPAKSFEYLLHGINVNDVLTFTANNMCLGRIRIENMYIRRILIGELIPK